MLIFSQQPTGARISTSSGLRVSNLTDGEPFPTLIPVREYGLISVLRLWDAMLAQSRQDLSTVAVLSVTASS